MSIKIGSNIASLTAQRRLGEADASLSKIFERLSSGQRINRASDDAAGLAIADDLNAKSRIYTQGIRNGNDGISLLNIADSAISALSSVVIRIRELSEQSANGTYSNTQRQALDAEAQALSKEFTRITQTTSFNGLKLFDGSLGSGVRLQLGVGIAESINASVGGNIGTGDFKSSGSYSTESSVSNAVHLADLNGDGFLDLVTAGFHDGHGSASVSLGLGNGTFGSAAFFTTEGFQSNAISMGDLNGDGVLDLITAGWADIGGGYIQGQATVLIGAGDGTFAYLTSLSTEFSASHDARTYSLSLGDLNGDGVLDLVSAGYAFDPNTSNYQGEATVLLGTGDGTFKHLTSLSPEFSATGSATTFSLSLGDLNGDGVLDLVSAGHAINEGSGVYQGEATVLLGAGDGTFNYLTSLSTEFSATGNARTYSLSLGDLNGDGVLDLVSAGYAYIGGSSYRQGQATVLIGTGDGTFAHLTSLSTEFSATGTAETYSLSLGDLNGDGVLDLVSAGLAFDDVSAYAQGQATVLIGAGDGTFANLSSLSTEFSATGNAGTNSLSLGDLNGDGVLDLVSAGFSYDGGDQGTATVLLSQTEDGLGAMLEFSLKTKSDSLQAMSMLDRTLENLAEQRGTIGASQSRIGIALSNLQTATENFKAAESRIRDADVAQESANLVRTQILQQAAASVLSQANAQPQLALQLLR